MKYEPIFLQDFDRFFIGFNEQMKKAAQLQTQLCKNASPYPPFNIKKTGENTYVIELAVAGFAKNEIEIEFDGDILSISGKANKNENRKEEYLYQGLASRAFTRAFLLDENVKVKNAAFVNGMIKVFLEQLVPEPPKPKKVEIVDIEEPSTVSDYTKGNTFKTGEQIFGPESE